ncbi:SLC13 family permease [Aquibaculum arenosum]|uniref:SLC13 family permease n=1 Tax=Aquibaculum arenosum TaxID=3032591 RepID=A0ABT5YP61_9PROT|nr:SLC13 family permease [Fodinicurvata sp. CAU 1616]MDF2096581.1 SLC13 family permease [Fodinicurvata sp. CAU 1616]
MAPTLDQTLILALIVAALGLFVWGRLRHDVVALCLLLAAVALGLVPTDGAFAGLGHPAVITVAAVLVLSRALTITGAVDVIANRALPQKAGPTLLILSACLLAAVLSAFMNNVGALALLMPVAIQAADRNSINPALVLMPLSFGSILGGMTTLIGTPPNLIVAGFRNNLDGGSFGMFAFTPVGLPVALVGVAFIAFIGWRLVPRAREGTAREGKLFDVGAYLSEVRLTPEAALEEWTVGELEDKLKGHDAVILALARDERRILVPHRNRRLTENDVVIIEADPEGLSGAASSLGLVLVGRDDENGNQEKHLQSDDVQLQEVVILPDSRLIGNSALEMRLRTRFGLNLIAVSRQGRSRGQRLNRLRFAPGDVLLLQGEEERISNFISVFGCAPLGSRGLRLMQPRQAAIAGALLIGGAATAALGIAPPALTFVGAALLAVLLRVLPLREVYTAIDGSVIVLLAALIPVANAVSQTGAAELVASNLVEHVARGIPVVALAVMLLVTMWLTDVMNNAATAAVMAPIAIGVSRSLDAAADPFLMAVAVGASCAFLTPIGHQNNTLILGPGGYRFGDFWRMGLPLQLLVLAVAVPMILLVWPL